MNSIIRAAARLTLCQARNRAIFLSLPAASNRLSNLNLHKPWARTVMTQVESANAQRDAPAPEARQRLLALERFFGRFEEKCQRIERVSERDFIKTFDKLTLTYESLEADQLLTPDVKVNLSLLGAILLRCCGKLMGESDAKTRELLAGNLWQFLKEKSIPLDISHYNSLLRVLNENQTNFDPEKILEEIKRVNLNPDRVTYQRLIHQYCMQGEIVKATSLLEAMKDLQMELNEATFASLIIGYSKQETPPSMEEMFELMKSNGIEPTSRSYAAAIIAQIHQMQKDPEKAEKEMAAVLDLVDKDDLGFSIYDVLDMLTIPNLNQQNETIQRLLDYICQTPYNFNSRYRLYNTLLEIGQYERVSRLYWHQEPSENVRRNQNLGAFYVKLLATHRNIPTEHVLKECTKLFDKKYNERSFYALYYSAAEVGNLGVVRAALKKISEEEPIKCQYLWPLLAQAKDENEIIETLKNDFNSKFNTNDLIETLTNWVWPKFADKVDKLFELNKSELKFDTNLLMASFLNYSVQENKILEAIKFVSEVPEELVGKGESGPNASNNMNPELESTDNNRESSAGSRGALIGRLLMQIAEHTKDPAIVNKAFNLCKLPGQAIANNSLTALVKVHILNEDYETAMKEFVRLATEFNVTACKPELIIHCLEKKDSESLQKIMDISNDLYGESNSLFDLAVCCLRSGKLKQAQKIFNSPNFRINPMRVYRVARMSAGNISVLENLVQLTRDMYDINQEILYQILIDAYEGSSNAKRVLDLWNRMQEEEFQPSKRSLLMIANVLERNGIEVPFQKPKMDLREFDRDGYGDRRDNNNY